VITRKHVHDLPLKAQWNIREGTGDIVAKRVGSVGVQAVGLVGSIEATTGNIDE
jgi:hypothetical protein